MEIGKIEKNIPIPKMRNSKYPWSNMSVGDSILIPVGEDEQLVIIRNRVSKSIHKYNMRTGKKFRSMSIPKENAVKVWRTK